MIEETPLLKRLAFKQSDTHWLTLWSDCRNPRKWSTIAELVRKKDKVVLVHEVYYYSDLAMKHYAQISKNMDAEHMNCYLDTALYEGKPCVDCGCNLYKDIEGWPQYVECRGCLQSKPREEVL